MPTTAKTKKKNPQDTTFRNINALKRRVTALETLTARLHAQVLSTAKALRALDQRTFSTTARIGAQ